MRVKDWREAAREVQAILAEIWEELRLADIPTIGPDGQMRDVVECVRELRIRGSESKTRGA